MELDKKSLNKIMETFYKAGGLSFPYAHQEPTQETLKVCRKMFRDAQKCSNAFKLVQHHLWVHLVLYGQL